MRHKTRKTAILATFLITKVVYVLALQIMFAIQWAICLQIFVLMSVEIYTRAEEGLQLH